MVRYKIAAGPNKDRLHTKIEYRRSEGLHKELFGVLAQLAVQGFSTCRILVVRVDIELDLRLGAGRTHADPVAALELIIEHIRGRQIHGLGTSCGHTGVSKIIANCCHLKTSQFLRRILAQVLHDRLHTAQAVHARQGLGDNLLDIVTVFLEDFLHPVIQRDPFRFTGSSHFRDQQGGVDPILVAHKGGRQEAIALFKTEEERVTARILELLDLFTDKLEACQGLEHIHAIMLADAVGQRSRNNRLDSCAILGQCTLLLLGGENVLQQDTTNLVTGQEMEYAVMSTNGHTQTVAVRIGSKNDIGMHFVSQLLGQNKRGRILGIRHLEGCEIRIGQFLLGNDRNLGDSN